MQRGQNNRLRCDDDMGDDVELMHPGTRQDQIVEADLDVSRKFGLRRDTTEIKRYIEDAAAWSEHRRKERRQPAEIEVASSSRTRDWKVPRVNVANK